MNEMTTNGRTTWKSNLGEEVQFWRSLFDRSCPNAAFVNVFHDRVANDRPFPPHLERLVRHVESDVVRVLDVGAGPLTQVGAIHPKLRVEITAIDPLADEYAGLFREFGLVPRVRTRKGHAERLTDLFSENSFHLVYCRNALDHSYDPLSGIRQMIEVCMPGCYCWLQHAVNEGQNQRYRGLHQWDFRPDGTDLAMYGKLEDATVRLSHEIGGLATVEAEGKKWCTVQIRKNPGVAA